jgi:hypothetical protein
MRLLATIVPIESHYYCLISFYSSRIDRRKFLNVCTPGFLQINRLCFELTLSKCDKGIHPYDNIPVVSYLLATPNAALQGTDLLAVSGS